MSLSARLLAPLLLAGAVAACAPTPGRTVSSPAAVAAAPATVADRLYFGRAIPGGGAVSQADWDAFLAEVVTPRFPGGLTVWRTDGQWRDESGVVVREESFVLELVHPAGPQSDAAVREIAAEYKRRFRQEAVMRVQSRVEVSF